MVVDESEESVGCGWEMAWEEVGEWKFVFFTCEVGGLGEKSPAEELGGFGNAVRTILLHWSFRGDFGLKDHLKSLDTDFWFVRREDQLTR